METTYQCNMGIGYRLSNPVNIEGLGDELWRKAYDLTYIIGERFKVVVGGNGKSNSEELYVIIDDDIDEKTNLVELKSILDYRLKSLGIDSIGRFGLVGGIEIIK